MAAKFEIIQRNNGEYGFQLYARNGKVIALSGERYDSADSCMAAVAAMQSRCSVPVWDRTKAESGPSAESRFELYKDPAGAFRFRFTEENGRVLAVSEGYKAKVSCLNAIQSVKRSAPEASVQICTEEMP